MDSASDNREHARYDEASSILIDAPSLSDAPLAPKDFSMGGLNVVIPEEPDFAGIIECAMSLFGERFEKCKAKVVWVMQNRTDPVTWSVGLSVHGPQKERSRFNELVQEAIEGMGGGG